MIIRPLLTARHAERLQDVERAYAVGGHWRRVMEVFDPARRMKPRKVFRDHLAIHGDVIVNPDVRYREALDLLLGGISALHVGGVGLNPADEDRDKGSIAWLLNKKSVRAYYEEYYPFAPAILARRALSGELPQEYLTAWADGLADPGFAAAYGQFLHIDARFIANDVIGDFIALTDDYYVRGDHISDLHDALQSPDELRHWLRKEHRWDLLDGMEAFFAVAMDLDAFLQSTDLPLLRGQVWLHFAYWFGNGGERMLEVGEWLRDAALQVQGALPFDEDHPFDPTVARTEAARLVAALERLMDPNLYPLELLRLAGASLEPWPKTSGVADRLAQRWELYLK